MSHPLYTVLRCTACGGRLQGSSLTCEGCGAVFQRRKELPSFLSEETRLAAEHAEQQDGENAFKNFFKRWPRFYDWFSFFISPVVLTGLTTEAFVLRQRADALVLNVGSGPTRLRADIMNVDLFPFSNVDVLAEAAHLPFADATFDAVASDQVLEHIGDVTAAVREMLRVTKPGGELYIGVPFVFPLHPSPSDFRRWSTEGLKSLFHECQAIETGVTRGPTAGAMSVLAVWLAILFSFGITPLRKVLKYVFMILLSPLKFLDYLYARLPGAEDTAAGIYLVAKK